MPLSHKEDEACSAYNQEIICEEFSWYPCQISKINGAKDVKGRDCGLISGTI
jgi:hypothetical protein